MIIKENQWYKHKKRPLVRAYIHERHEGDILYSILIMQNNVPYSFAFMTEEDVLSGFLPYYLLESENATS